MAKKTDSNLKRFLARAQAREDAAAAKRLRQLSAGFKRATPHFNSDDLSELEEIVAGAIGRSIIRAVK